MAKKDKKYMKQKEEYGYDFVPELSHILNIDEQRVNAKKLEKITDKKRGKCE